ncbi:branched-chain amino acid transporter permease [Methanolobus bombayensis]|uniref:branched-chain amino acid transporter permease n=1 Tax=Methanolobus bombayensis TaxID=38023 RepID=UPI001AE94871|nr:AzlD domain-containing protein [Methanolobus bombayensis]MBP1909914.1 branched-subunit amino acid transport protein AzlD [Methanolobus bombayensis]
MIAEDVSSIDIIWIIVITALITAFTRALPFIFFRRRKQPECLKVIERDFPAMIMLLLVFYCLNSVSWGMVPYGLPELLCIFVVACLHIWKGNALLSIFTGTIIYMYFTNSGIITVLLTEIIRI